MENNSIHIPGALVTIPLPGRQRPLDGFWVRAAGSRRPLLIFVHGMHSNFYRSRFKKEIMRQAARHGFDVLSFNNRGHEQQVIRERFTDCLGDLDAVLRFGRKHGYAKFVLMGHSTGCQKITYYQAVRQRPDVAALVLAGPGDDLALCRRDLGKRYAYWLRRARRLAATGRGNVLLPHTCHGFSARRFLSIAHPASLEARLFDFDGPMTHFRRMRCPVLVVVGAREEFACIPVPEMCARLHARSRSRAFDACIIPGADHGFHHRERATASTIFRRLSAALCIRRTGPTRNPRMMACRV